MNMAASLLLILGTSLLFLGGDALLFQKNPFWSDLTTTWEVDGFVPVPFYKPKGYNPVPRGDYEATRLGKWVKISETCDNDGLFAGFRYVEKLNATHNDYGASVLFDKNGYVAGIQMNLLVSATKIDTTNTYKFEEVPYFVKNTINGEEYYTITSYFVDPKTICSVGRNSPQFVEEGTGTLLGFQKGPGIDNIVVVPQKKGDAIKAGFSNLQCFAGMGDHVWLDFDGFQGTNCDYMPPFFPLYTQPGNKLLGFGFITVGKHNGISNRFEHPLVDVVLSLIIGPKAPQCLKDKFRNHGVTAMHVYLIDKPNLQNCIL